MGASKRRKAKLGANYGKPNIIQSWEDIAIATTNCHKKNQLDGLKMLVYNQFSRSLELTEAGISLIRVLFVDRQKATLFVPDVANFKAKRPTSTLPMFIPESEFEAKKKSHLDDNPERLDCINDTLIHKYSQLKTNFPDDKDFEQHRFFAFQWDLPTRFKPPYNQDFYRLGNGVAFTYDYPEDAPMIIDELLICVHVDDIRDAVDRLKNRNYSDQARQYFAKA